MVSKASGTWRIHGTIDWDDAVALPDQLFVYPLDGSSMCTENSDVEDGYFDNDQY